MKKAKAEAKNSGGQKLDQKTYDQELAKLHGELVKLQQ